VLWGGCWTPQGATFKTLISRRARGARFLRREGSFLKYPLSRSLWQEREGKWKRI
jgi:anaerobic selenocysteine-containing dehydrogenase